MYCKHPLLVFCLRYNCPVLGAVSTSSRPHLTWGAAGMAAGSPTLFTQMIPACSTGEGGPGYRQGPRVHGLSCRVHGTNIRAPFDRDHPEATAAGRRSEEGRERQHPSEKIVRLHVRLRERGRFIAIADPSLLRSVRSIIRCLACAALCLHRTRSILSLLICYPRANHKPLRT